MPVTITKVLTSPDVGLSVMSGVSGVTVNGFEDYLDPSDNFNSMISIGGRWYVEGSSKESSRGTSHCTWTCSNRGSIKFYSNSGTRIKSSTCNIYRSDQQVQRWIK